MWQEFTPLAKEAGAVNLGQGFPDWESPRFVKDALIRATNENHNQYARSAGHPPLVQAIAKRYSKALGRELDWENEITIGVGSSESLYAIMMALVEPEDEVIMISPAFDIYSAQVLMAGGKCVYVPLRLKAKDKKAADADAAPGAGAAAAVGGAGAGDAAAAGPAGGSAGSEQEWTLDMEELRAAFTPRTRAIILNTPQNPTGKMLSREELEGVAAILKDFPRVVAVSDEVYEHMSYEGRTHTRMATLPGMWDRTLTVTSAGKTFSVTGWKIGWVIGPAPLVRGVVLTNQWVQFSVSTPAQQAIAYCLEEADKPYEGHPTYYDWLRSEYSRKRAILAAGLTAAGLKPVLPEGGFFIMADTSAVEVPPAYLAETTPASGPVMRRDWAFCRFLTKEIGVAAIPPSAFYEEKDRHLAANVARFAFCKEDPSLHEACSRLLKLRAFLRDAPKAE